MQDTVPDTFVLEWTEEEVCSWLEGKEYDKEVISAFKNHKITGKSLLCLDESDFKYMNITVVGYIKSLRLDIQQLRLDNKKTLLEKGYDPLTLLLLRKTQAAGSQKWENNSSVMNSVHDDGRPKPKRGRPRIYFNKEEKPKTPGRGRGRPKKSEYEFEKADHYEEPDTHFLSNLSE